MWAVMLLDSFSGGNNLSEVLHLWNYLESQLSSIRILMWNVSKCNCVLKPESHGNVLISNSDAQAQSAIKAIFKLGN